MGVCVGFASEKVCKMTKLTDKQIKAAKSGDKKIKLADGGGLTLIFHPKGGKTWVWRYRVDGKQREMTLGSYTSFGLKDARQRVEAQRNLLDTKITPNVAETVDFPQYFRTT